MAEETPTSAAPQAATPQASQPAAAPAIASPASESPPSNPVETAAAATILGGDDVPEAPASEPQKIDAPAEAPAPEKVDAPKEGEQPSEKPVEKPAEQKKNDADGAKPQPDAKAKEEGGQSDEPAPLPSFDKWEFPEGVTVDQAQVGDFNKELGEFAMANKLDAKAVQSLGQKLINRHVAEVQTVAEKIAQAYQKVWTDQSQKWYNDFVNDPEIGGKRQDTTIQSAREFIRRHGGSPEQQTEIRKLMFDTKVGNHPALIRLFAKANMAMREPKPLQASTPPSENPKSRTQKFYGKKS